MDLAPRIATLESALAQEDLPGIFEQLMAIVPDYEPSQSILDRMGEQRAGAARVRPVADSSSHLHVV